MEKQNKKIFLVILYSTLFVVAVVWIATAPDTRKTPAQQPAPPVMQAKPATVPPAPVIPKKPVAPVAPKVPVAPTPITTDMGIPALKAEKPISALVMPDIAPNTLESKHVDPRIAATVLTSGDGFDRLVDGAVSLFVYIFTH